MKEYMLLETSEITKSVMLTTSLAFLSYFIDFDELNII